MTVLNSGLSHSYSTQRDKDLPRFAGFDFSSQIFDDETTKSPATIGNQVNLSKMVSMPCHSLFLSGTFLMYLLILKGAITRLLEQISTINDRIDNVTSKVEELSAKFSIQRDLSSSQKAEACNGSAPMSYLVSSSGNSLRTGSTVLSSSSSLLAKESLIMEEVR